MEQLHAIARPVFDTPIGCSVKGCQNVIRISEADWDDHRTKTKHLKDGSVVSGPNIYCPDHYWCSPESDG